ncbi:MAG TPA: 3-oxoacyl-[acyl-carrier-protein] synthase III C-terminal domain-containing protein [Kiloniellales bacterium]|nr:3-oxoacyl-[acyl-carrier-protein] synthase III C-terminal domain-containing protein [Kiloniellales bacterium]
MPGPVRLVSLASAVPPFVLRQRDVQATAEALFRKRGSDIARLLPVFDNAGIETRYSCVPLDWYHGPVGWKERNALFVEQAVELLRRSAADCLARARIRPEQVDSIVAVSTSGIATPSLDARLMEVLPFRRSVQRLPIFGLGCAGGVLGLARAGALARAAPGSLVLLLVVELCGLTFRSRDQSKSNVIATALFGDGAAAALVSCDKGADGPELAGWGEYTWPDSLEVMGWRIEEDGFGVLFSRDIPTIIRERYGTALDDFLAAHGLSRADLDGTLCHPGGAKVLEALEAVFGLPPGGMDDARAVLRDYGNMSAATVLFVIERALSRGLHGRHLVSALGPGFTAGFLLLEAP